MAVVIKLSLIQFLFTLTFSAVNAFFWSDSHGWSALLGGLTCTVANLFFAGKLFQARNNHDPKLILRHFYRSESLKLAFTFAIFILVFKLIEIEFLSFILAYSFTALLNLLCLPFLNSQ